MTPPPGPPPPLPPPPPARGARPRRGLVLGLGLGGAALLLLVVVGLALLADRTRSGTSLAELRRGECFNAEKAVIDLKASRVPCRVPHTDEVAGIVTLPAGRGSEYPGTEGILELGQRECAQQESEFLGARPRRPTTQVYVFGPNEGAWKNGDRAVVCSLREESGAKRTGSYLDG